MFERDQYEGAPYQLLLSVMGSQTPTSPHELLSNDIWSLDTECVEGPGSYVAIARRLQLLAKGDLPLVEIADHFTDDAIWLTFRLAGKDYRWQAQVDEDWLDGQVLSAFGKLLVKQGSSRRFTYSNTGGQDCLIGCATPAELSDLNALGGPRFVWLS